MSPRHLVRSRALSTLLATLAVTDLAGCGEPSTSDDAGIDYVLPDGAPITGDGAMLDDGGPPTGPCASVRAFPGGFALAATGERTLAYGVTHWTLSGTPGDHRDPIVEALGWDASGALRLVGWLQAPERDAAAALSDTSDEAAILRALPALAFETAEPDPDAREHRFGLDEVEALRLWIEIDASLPPGECFARRTALVDRTSGTALATCEAEHGVANAELLVSIARTVSLLGCMAQARLGAPITTCDLDDLASVARSMALDAAADAIERYEPSGRDPVIVPKGDLPSDPEEMDRLFERIRRESDTRKIELERWRSRFAGALRLLGDVLSIIDLVRSFVQAWLPYARALDSLGCCQGGNVGGMTGCTCAERFPPDAEGRGGAPVWRQVSGAATSYLCEACPEGYTWDPDASPFIADPSLPRLARELSRPIGDRGACVREVEEPRWDACPRSADGVDYDALRARADVFAATVGDPRVQVVDVRVDGMPCPAFQRVRAYVGCNAGSAEYVMAPVGGAVTTIGTSLCRLGLCDWVYHLGYRPNGMLERGEISPGTTDGFGTVWTGGGASSRDPGVVCDDIVARAPLGGRSIGAPLVAYPDTRLDEAERAALGLPEIEGGWCYDEIDFIDMAHHLETSSTCSPTVLGALLAVIYPRELSEIRDPSQAERRCVGAVGSDTCVAPQASLLPNACGAEHRGAGDGCVADPHFDRHADGTEHHGVSVESLDYAECCRESPDGFMCRGTVGSLRCSIVFNASMHAASEGSRTWRALFSTELAPPTLSTIDATGAPTTYGRLLAAPEGTPLILDDASAFCRDGAREGLGCAFSTSSEPATEPERAVTPEGLAPASGSAEGACARIDPASGRPRELARSLRLWSTAHRSRTDDPEGSRSYADELERRTAALEELEDDPLWEHHELWAQRDGRGAIQAVALLRLHEDEETGVAEGWRVLELAEATRGYAPMLLSCVADDLRARGELPIRIVPAAGTEALWEATVARLRDPALTRPVWPIDEEEDGTLVLGRTLIDLHSHLNGVPSWREWLRVAGYGAGGAPLCPLAIEIMRRYELGLYRGSPAAWLILRRAYESTDALRESCTEDDASELLRLLLTASNGGDFTHAYVLRGLVHDLGFEGRQSEQPAAALDATLARLCEEGIAYSEQSVGIGQLANDFTPEALAAAYARMPVECDTEVRFLAAVSRGNLARNLREVDVVRIETALRRPDVIGLDIVGAEHDSYRTRPAIVRRIVELLDMVEAAARERGRPLLFRPHVGEGATGIREMSPELGTLPRPDGESIPDFHIWGGPRSAGEPLHVPRARDNLIALLDAIGPYASRFVELEDAMRDADAIADRTLIVRFGHATHASTSIAARMASLGVLADVNLTSNWVTGASIPPDVRLDALPDRALTVATADVRMLGEGASPFASHGLFPMLAAGVPIALGTDGQGVEWSSMSGTASADTPDMRAIDGEPRRMLQVLESCHDGRAPGLDGSSCSDAPIERAARQRVAGTTAWGTAERYLQVVVCDGDTREGLPVSRACEGRRR